MKFRKKLLLRSLGIIVASSLIATPIIACGPKTSNVVNDNNSPSNNDGINGTGNNGSDSNSSDGDTNTNNGNNTNNESDNNNGTQSQKKECIVSNEISDAAKFDDSNFETKTSNAINAIQNIKDFLSNGNFAEFKGSKNELEKDILLYFYQLSKNNKELIFSNPLISSVVAKSATKTNDENTSNSNDVTDLILNNTLLSFDAQVEITSNINQTIIINSHSINVEKDKSYFLKINVNNQLIKPHINEYNSLTYLSWNVGEVNFSINNQTWTESNFTFVQNYLSHIFKYKFENLVNGYTYFDLKDKYENDAYNIDDNNLQNYVTSYINNSFETYIKYADYSRDILNLIKQDIPIDTLIQKMSPILINALVDANVIPSTLKNFLLEALYGSEKDNQTISQVPLINAISTHSNEIAQFVATLLNTNDVSGVQTILQMFKPGMTKEDPIYQTMLNLLSTFGVSQDVINIITGDVLGITSGAKPLINILFDNYNTLFKYINDTLPNLNYLTGIEKILNIIVSKNGTSYNSIYDAILSTNETKQTFLDALKSLVSINAQIGQILKILIIDNDSLNKANIMAIVNSLSNFMNGIFETNSSYKDITDKYKNLTFTKVTNKIATLDKTNKTISFDYEYDFVLNNPVNLDLSVFKKLISSSASKELINQMIKQYAGNLSWLANIATSVIGTDNIMNTIYHYLPDTITFGENSKENKLSFKFVADNSKTWFKPILNMTNGNYTAGFDFLYNMNIFYDDPSMIDSITKNYNNKPEYPYSSVLTANYSDVWRTIISNILYRDYNVSLKYSVNSNKVIANTSNYDEDQIYGKYSFENNVNDTTNGEFIKSLMQTTDLDSNYVKVYSNFQQDKKYQWKNDTNSETIVGYKPIVSEKNFNTIKEKLFKFNTSITDYGLSINTIFNTELKINLDIWYLFSSYSLNFNFDFMLTTIDLYLPFKILDTKTGVLVDSIHKNISYSNFVSSQN